MKRISTKWAAAATVAAVAVGVTGFGLAANADTQAPSFKVYDELDSPNPSYAAADGATPAGLVFVKATDIGWSVDNALIGDVKSLGFTVASSTSYAPSFQLVLSAVRPDTNGQPKYTRLAWEANQQAGLDPDKGTYTDLQDGKWWSNKVPAGQPGSQGDPQPLAFFKDGGDAGWTGVKVTAIDLHQGTTTESTSLVTDVTYNGHVVPLGVFAQGDIDAAVSPLKDEISTLESTISDKNAEIDGLKGQVATKEAAIAELNQTIAALNDSKNATAAVEKLTAQVTDLVSQVTDLNGKISSLQDKIDTLKAQESALTAYKSTHHIADGTDMGVSRVLLSSTPVHGKTVGISKSGTIATSKVSSLKYQWYLSGKAVSGATKSTYLVPSSAKGKSVSVKVTATYSNYIVFAVHSNTATTK